jgi:hypothetical protein
MRELEDGTKVIIIGENTKVMAVLIACAIIALLLGLVSRYQDDHKVCYDYDSKPTACAQMDNDIPEDNYTGS